MMLPDPIAVVNEVPIVFFLNQAWSYYTVGQCSDRDETNLCEQMNGRTRPKEAAQSMEH